VEKTKRDKWDCLEMAGIVLLEWVAWMFLAFFVVFILYAMVRGFLEVMT